MTLRALVLVGMTLSAGSLVAQTGVRFDPGCELPFAEIAVEREVDRWCGPQGSGKLLGRRLQDEQKNNFCALGEPILLLNREFSDLHDQAARAGFTGAKKREPEDRQGLRDAFTIRGQTIGEGTLVQHAGWIDDALYLKSGKLESVNCNREGDGWKDLHLELVELRQARNHHRITTEVSPHFRPNEWTPDNLAKVQALGLPLRVTGSLFYDASHRRSRLRSSNWEIHPVYRIEVCNSEDLAACRAGQNGTSWTDLHLWLARQ